MTRHQLPIPVSVSRRLHPSARSLAAAAAAYDPGFLLHLEAAGQERMAASPLGHCREVQPRPATRRGVR
jgi:hypothetical protein